MATPKKRGPENRIYRGSPDECFVCKVFGVRDPDDPVAISWTRTSDPVGEEVLIAPTYVCEPCAGEARSDERYEVEPLDTDDSWQ